MLKCFIKCAQGKILFVQCAGRILCTQCTFPCNNNDPSHMQPFTRPVSIFIALCFTYCCLWEQDNSPPDNCPPQIFFSFISVALCCFTLFGSTGCLFSPFPFLILCDKFLIGIVFRYTILHRICWLYKIWEDKHNKYK
jgi:hypothetical protein